MQHVRSYYAASANPAPLREPLRGDVMADVCVVGGGIAGCSTALNLAERGYSVVLLEGKRVGWGASGRSGGQALFGYASGQEKLIATVGHETARRMFDVSVEALDVLKQRVARHAIDCDLNLGQVHAAIKPRHETELKAWREELERDYGYDSLVWLDQRDIRELLATKRYIGGLHDSRSGHLHPLNYTLGLARAAENAGARIFDGSQVIRIDHGDTVTLTTAGGSVRAKHVALCCNAYVDEKVSAKLRARIMPVGTYIVATEPLGEARMKALMRDNVAVTDINWVLDYFRRSADHRLLFGGRVELFRPSARLHAARHPGADAVRIPAACRRRRRLLVGRLRRHHDEPRAGLRTARAERLLPAGILGPRHRAHRHGGPTGRGGDRRPGRALRHVHQAPAPRFPGRAGAAHAGAGTRDAVVPA